MIDSKIRGAGFVLATALTLGGCASMGNSNPVNQEVALRTLQDGQRIEAACEVGNDVASWTVLAPAMLSVTRSEKPLTVQCRTLEGAEASQSFPAIKFGDLPLRSTASYGYPAVLELQLIPRARSRSMQVGAPSYAPIDDVSRVPMLGEEGREGYRRFLAGGFPRAFAISADGRWARVNSGGDASRLALEQCQSYGARCQLYAVDDQIM